MNLLIVQAHFHQGLRIFSLSHVMTNEHIIFISDNLVLHIAVIATQFVFRKLKVLLATR